MSESLPQSKQPQPVRFTSQECKSHSHACAHTHTHTSTHTHIHTHAHTHVHTHIHTRNTHTHTQTHTSTHTTHTQHTRLHLAAHTMINTIFSPHSSFTSLKQLVRAQTGVEEDYIELYFENLPLAPRPREMISLDRLPQTSVSALCNCAHNWMPCDNATISMGYVTISMG